MSRIQRHLWKSAGALAAVLLALSCGGGGSSPTEPGGAGPKTVTVVVKDNSYEPRTVIINPGDTIRWVMQGTTPDHTVTALNGAFDSGNRLAASGAVFERRFLEANQTFDYSCQTHKDCCNMKGSVRVGDSAPPPTPGYE
ncbi:MAG TPA: hypothetical protein VF789_06135 [Thermoanaerobaculia bacterium]